MRIPPTHRTRPTGFDLRPASMENPSDTQIPVPDVTFDDRYDFTLGDRRIELHHVPGGETNDSLVVWLPDEKVALVGNFFSALIVHIPIWSPCVAIGSGILWRSWPRSTASWPSSPT